MPATLLEHIINSSLNNQQLLAVLVDPEDFNVEDVVVFLRKLPKQTSHLFVGGSTATHTATEETVCALKAHTTLPIILFPGDYTQVTDKADGILFLSLLSGRNSEYLIGQQVKATKHLKNATLEILPTAYLLIDGGNQSAVARVSNTEPMSQDDPSAIVATALAGQFMGSKLIYLEAGSGAEVPVSAKIIYEVKKAVNIPLIVGGGIRTATQMQTAYNAGANMVVMGTVFEESSQAHLSMSGQNSTKKENSH